MDEKVKQHSYLLQHSQTFCRPPQQAGNEEQAHGEHIDGWLGLN